MTSADFNLLIRYALLSRCVKQ